MARNIAKMKWLRRNKLEEFVTFQRGTITRSEFPLGGYVYSTRADGKETYSGNDLTAALDAMPEGIS